MLRDKKILVCGAGGVSGRAASRLLLELGATIYLSDARPGEESGDELSELAREESERCFDLRPRQDSELLAEFKPDTLLLSPGLSPELPLLKKARALKLPIRGENDLAAELIDEKWPEPPVMIGLTGTDGKSTVCALLTHLISEGLGRAAVACGNYGRPLSSLVLDRKAQSDGAILVVECSSFQLEQNSYFHPAISLILNVTRDHMDRYETTDDYLNAKLKLIVNQKREDLLIAPPEIIAAARSYYGAQMPPLRLKAPEDIAAVRVTESEIYFTDHLLSRTDELKLLGAHNRSNIRFVLAALSELIERYEIKYDVERLATALKSFGGLPHRQELVGRADGLIFINDSKATTLQSLHVALQAARELSPQGGVHLLCGGRDKGSDFSELPWQAERLRIYPFGEAAELIAAGAPTAGGEPPVTYRDLEAAFQSALQAAKRDDHTEGEAVILLSPGCASQDAYTSYQERGEHFRRLATDYISKVEVRN